LCPQKTEDVRLLPGVAEDLDLGLKSRAKNKKVFRRGQLQLDEDGNWQVLLEERPIGTLGNRHSGAFNRRSTPGSRSMRVLRFVAARDGGLA
jgi:hypothetical protein